MEYFLFFPSKHAVPTRLNILQNIRVEDLMYTSSSCIYVQHKYLCMWERTIDLKTFGAIRLERQRISFVLNIYQEEYKPRRGERKVALLFHDNIWEGSHTISVYITSSNLVLNTGHGPSSEKNEGDRKVLSNKSPVRLQVKHIAI